MLVILYQPFEFPLLYEFPIPNLCSFFYSVILLLSIYRGSFNINSFNHLTVIYHVHCFPQSVTCLLFVSGGYVLLKVERTCFWIFMSCFISLERKKEDNKGTGNNKAHRSRLWGVRGGDFSWVTSCNNSTS